LKDTLDELERTNAIARVSFKPWCVLPLQLVHRVGKASRVVIDGSFQINPYLRERKVKLTTLKEFNQGVLAGDVWASLDLRSGYYHVGIHPDYRSLFGIKWVEAGKVQYYVWLVCFLGIADLVRTFTKLFKPIIGRLQCNGVEAGIYIDDLRAVARGVDKLVLDMMFTRDLLAKAGFVESVNKAVGPTTSAVFLGLINDTARLMYFIPEYKLTAVLDRISRMIGLKRAPIRDVASLYGQLSAFGPATGPAIRLLTRIGQRAFSGSAAIVGWNLVDGRGRAQV
jgi:hypothetical protein